MRNRTRGYPEREAGTAMPVAIILILIIGMSGYLLIGDFLTDNRQLTRVYPPEHMTVAVNAKKAP